jgi:phosphatidylserine/phosphatidylglycerophosphate/cardiolipin synthase-like enzyme
VSVSIESILRTIRENIVFAWPASTIAGGIFAAALSCQEPKRDPSKVVLGEPEAAASLSASAAGAPSAATSGSLPYEHCGDWEIRFSPKWGNDEIGCEGAVVKFLSEAQKYVVMQAYGFTSDPITNVLCALGDRGVSVNVVLDKSDKKEEDRVTKLRNHRVSVWFDAQHAIAHNKVTIVDGVSVEEGSFNYTRAGQDRNAENCLFIRRCQPIAAPYLQNYMMHQSHSVSEPKER